MRPFKAFYLFILMGLLVISCQKDTLEPVQEITEPTHEFTVPDIPDDIANLMNAEDLARFRAGPGEEYLNSMDLNDARRSHGRWYPVLMKLGYHLQFGPFVGGDCEAPVPCYGPSGPTGAPGCDDPLNWTGTLGATIADGYWFNKEVHSEYYPVFCTAENYAGYGQGFYALKGGTLSLEAESGPHIYDDMGNMVFCRKGNYIGAQSTGIFEGVCGWEVMISYTAADNNPGNPDNMGQGFSDAIIFGWVFY